MTSFDFDNRTRIVFGAGKIAELGGIARELGAQRAMIVSDRGVVAAGHTERGIVSLQGAGVDLVVFSEVRENPDTDVVDAALAVARDFNPDLLVGLGGGSSMDCCKGVNFLFSNGGRMQDYWGVGKARFPMLPMIAVPTTAGTGSETQSYALISDPVTHVKMACGDKKAACRVAILDPELSRTMPHRITALTGVDAVSHAVESFVTKRRNPISQAFSREAWRLLSSSFLEVLQRPDHLEARGNMLMGASFAGMAIENSMLGAAHALANPLTAHYNIPHGQAVALMLPHVVRYNGELVPTMYDDLAESSVPILASRLTAGPSSTVETLSDWLTDLTTAAGLTTKLEPLGVERNELATLAEEAAKQWTCSFNPRELGAPELLWLYEQAW